MTRISHVVVAVPARDEEALLGECLRRIESARRELSQSRPEISVETVVALDTCIDDSAAVVSGFGVVGVPAQCGCVGVARDIAVQTGLALASTPPHSVWIANTDADSTVPAHWLATQIELADAGHDLVVGTVEPVGMADPVRLARWQERHALVEGHSHVHGANLGVRATAWQLAGGFGPHSSHEDVRLVRRLRAAGMSVVATDRTRVCTSARLIGRVDAGFADYLNGLRLGLPSR